MSLRYWPPGYWGRADDVTAHSGLTGLAADDHPQYALLAGRAGGQTLTGGTAASNTLTLSSTSHATKGKILFGTSAYDEVNNRLGVRTASPTAAFTVDYGTANTSTTTPIFEMHNPAAGTQSNVVFSFAGVQQSKIRAGSGGEMVFASKGGQYFCYTSDYGAAVDVQFGSQAAPFLVGKGATSRVGIRHSTPEAILQLGNGMASAGYAPLKFTTGTLLTTPEAGAMEYNNTLWFTASDAVRRSIVLSSGTYTGGAVAVGGTVQVNINGTNYNMLVQ